jgi:hypothetical protein
MIFLVYEVSKGKTEGNFMGDTGRGKKNLQTDLNSWSEVRKRTETSHHQPEFKVSVLQDEYFPTENIEKLSFQSKQKIFFVTNFLVREES